MEPPINRRVFRTPSQPQLYESTQNAILSTKRDLLNHINPRKVFDVLSIAPNGLDDADRFLEWANTPESPGFDGLPSSPCLHGLGQFSLDAIYSDRFLKLESPGLGYGEDLRYLEPFDKPRSGRDLPRQGPGLDTSVALDGTGPDTCTRSESPVVAESRQVRNTTGLGKGTISCPYPNCKSHFTRQADRDRHVKSKHMQRTLYKCRFAGCRRRVRGFTRKDNRHQHEQRVHGVDGMFEEKDEERQGEDQEENDGIFEEIVYLSS